MARKQTPEEKLREAFPALLDAAIAKRFPGVTATTEWNLFAGPGVGALVTTYEPEIRGKRKVAEVKLFTDAYSAAISDARDALLAAKS